MVADDIRFADMKLKSVDSEPPAYVNTDNNEVTSVIPMLNVTIINVSSADR